MSLSIINCAFVKKIFVVTGHMQGRALITKGLFDIGRRGGRARQPSLGQPRSGPEHTQGCVWFPAAGEIGQERLCLFSSSQPDPTPTTSNYQMEIVFDFGPASHRLYTRTSSVEKTRADLRMQILSYKRIQQQQCEFDQIGLRLAN
jgi:hypothetical protein